MKAVVWHGVGDIRLDDVPEPKIKEPEISNLTLKMGNCNHRKYIPRLIDFARTGVVDPTQILTETEPLGSAIEAHRQFDLRHRGWTKVKLEPAA